MFPAFWVEGNEGEDVKVGMPNAPFTVTSLFILLAVAGEDALSDTNMQ